MPDDLRSLELELETHLLTKAAQLAERGELRDDYQAQRINGAAWFKREQEIEQTLAELHVKISALEARIGTGRSPDASDDVAPR